jgi:hypothetical protein
MHLNLKDGGFDAAVL